MATPRDIKDRIAKRLFRHPRLVRDMLGAFVPAEWTAALDLDSLRELPAEFINPKGDKRLGDLLLLAGAPGGPGPARAARAARPAWAARAARTARAARPARTARPAAGRHW